jgi:hypothetical protein
MISTESLLGYVTFPNILLAIVSFISYKIVSQIVYYRFFSPLRIFPGPFWGSVTRLWLGWHCWRQTELGEVKKLHEKYGAFCLILFRFGMQSFAN